MQHMLMKVVQLGIKGFDTSSSAISDQRLHTP